MYLIGLTGGIAAGKSVVAARLRELGAILVDADAIAREVVEPGTPALADIVAHFGDGVLHPDGTLNRQALGAIVFSDPAQRAVLNGITHPAIRRRSQELFALAEAANPHAVAVYDIPLLVEAPGDVPAEFDLVVVVHASVHTRLKRLIELRGMSYEEAMHRLGSQANDSERLAIADVVIDTDGTLDETLRQVDALWAKVSATASRASGAVPKLD